MKKIMITFSLIFVFIFTMQIAIGFYDPNLNILNFQQYTPEGTNLTLYKIDLHQYLQNLTINIQTTRFIEIEYPTKTWNDDLFNNLAVILNILIMVLNVLLLPIRVGGYLASNILAILGYKVVDLQPTTAIGNFIKFIVDIQTWQIPYIN